MARTRESQHFKLSNTLLINLIQSAADAVIAADMSGTILIFNNAAAEICGYSEEEVLSRLNIRGLYPEGGARQVMKILRSEEFGGKGKLMGYQTNLLGKNGNLIPIMLNAAIVYENGREVATVGFFHDLRETLEMKRELERTQLQLLQAEKMASLGKLAAGVAHQLNNPLGGMTLFAEAILEEYDLEERVREDLKRILADARRCRDIVKELLEFARQGRQEMIPHDINKAISRTLFLLEDQTLFQNIEVEKHFASSLPPIPGNRQQLNHLLMNIILNAVEAMQGKGRLSLSTSLSPLKDRVSIEIADTGPGIPDDILPRIFEPFFTTKEEGKGTGLGLSLAYTIVANHKGHISVRTEVGKGTTFVIELPVARKEAGEETGKEHEEEP